MAGSWWSGFPQTNTPCYKLLYGLPNKEPSLIPRPPYPNIVQNYKWAWQPTLYFHTCNLGFWNMRDVGIEINSWNGCICTYNKQFPLQYIMLYDILCWYQNDSWRPSYSGDYPRHIALHPHRQQFSITFLNCLVDLHAQTDKIQLCAV